MRSFCKLGYTDGIKHDFGAADFTQLKYWQELHFKCGLNRLSVLYCYYDIFVSAGFPWQHKPCKLSLLQAEVLDYIEHHLHWGFVCADTLAFLWVCKNQSHYHWHGTSGYKAKDMGHLVTEPRTFCHRANDMGHLVTETKAMGYFVTEPMIWDIWSHSQGHGTSCHRGKGHGASGHRAKNMGHLVTELWTWNILSRRQRTWDILLHSQRHRIYCHRAKDMGHLVTGQGYGTSCHRVNNMGHLVTEPRTFGLITKNNMWTHLHWYNTFPRVVPQVISNQAKP